MARGLKFRIYKVEELYYLSSENKALISFAGTAKLLCVLFSHICKTFVFSRRDSNDL